MHQQTYKANTQTIDEYSNVIILSLLQKEKCLFDVCSLTLPKASMSSFSLGSYVEHVAFVTTTATTTATDRHKFAYLNVLLNLAKAIICLSGL